MKALLGVSACACSTRYSTHFDANRVAWMRSKGDGSPPCWMAEDRLSHVGQVPALPFEQRSDEGRLVDRVDVLAADHQSEPLPASEAGLVRLEVFFEVCERDTLLRQIDVLGAGGEAAHQRDVSAVVPHHFDDEASAGSTGQGLADCPNDADGVIRVGAPWSLRPAHAGSGVTDRALVT